MYLHGEKISDTKGFFNLEEKGIMKMNCWKLEPYKFKLERRYTFNTEGEGIPREVIDSLSLQVCESRLAALLEDML